MAILRNTTQDSPDTGRDWIDSQGQFIFGKHKGELVENVISEDPSYIRWIVSEVENISEDDRDFLSQQLKYNRR